MKDIFSFKRVALKLFQTLGAEKYILKFSFRKKAKKIKNIKSIQQVYEGLDLTIKHIFLHYL